MKKWKLIIKERQIHFPTLSIPLIKFKITLPISFNLKSPTITGLNLGKRSKSVVASALIVSSLVVGGAIYFSIEGLDQVPVYPEPAVYDAGASQARDLKTIGEGQRNSQPTQTLFLEVGGARIQDIIFTDVNVGADSPSFTDAISISSTGSGSIVCEKLEIIDVESPTFKLGTSTIYSLSVGTTTADGVSINGTLSNDPVDYRFGSTRGALNIPAVSGVDVDRIIIQNSGTATTTIGTIRFERVSAFNTGINLANLTCSSVVIKGTDSEKSIFGDGTGIDNASFRIGSTDGSVGTVKVSSIPSINNIVERNVSVK